MQKLAIFISLLIIVFSFSGCTTGKLNEFPPKAMDEDYIEDSVDKGSKLGDLTAKYFEDALDILEINIPSSGEINESISERIPNSSEVIEEIEDKVPNSSDVLEKVEDKIPNSSDVKDYLEDKLPSGQEVKEGIWNATDTIKDSFKESGEVIGDLSSSNNTSKKENKTLNIVYLDADGSVKQIEKNVKSNSNLDTINEVLKHLGVDDNIIYSTEIMNNQVTIDFHSTVLELDKTTEKQVLNSIALTYILSKDCEGIYYYIDGNSYSSDNITVVDGFYMSKNILLNNWDDLYPNRLN